MFLQDRKLVDTLQVERITFTEVTERAVLDAMKHPRQVSGQLAVGCILVADVGSDEQNNFC